MMDFKVRAVDFLSIYVKQRAYQGDSQIQIKLIRGLLKGLSTANADKHQILFERIKSVLALMAKQGQPSSSQTSAAQSNSDSNDADETKVLLTEMSKLVTKQHKEVAMQKAYADCFVLLTSHYYESGNQACQTALAETYRNLVSKLLTGRVLAGASLNKRFLQTVFEKCPALAWSMHDPILKCFLGKNSEDSTEGSRNNHQRVLAIELYQLLIKVASTDSKAKAILAKNFELLVAAICKVIQTSDTWKQKKVKSTGLCIGLYAKAARVLSQNSDDSDLKVNVKKIVSETGVKLIKQIETAIEADKTMSNLKGKVKEIKKIIEL